MKTVTRTSSSIIMFTLIALGLCSVPSAENAEHTPEQAPQVRFEARLISDSPEPEWTESRDPAGEKIYLSPEPTLTNKDISKAWVEASGPEPVIGLLLTEDGALKLARVTRNNIGQKIALMIDGQVTAAPVIRAPITAGRAMITGRFTKEEARRIAEALSS